MCPALSRGFFHLGADPFVVLGRSKACEVAIFSEEVSRRHAQIGSDETGCTIVDLGSSNGTKVNGERVRAPRRLRNDDVISLGTINLRFLVLECAREELAARFEQRNVRTSQCSTSSARRMAAPVPQFAGHFSGTVLYEACQLIELNRRSGEMRVMASGLDGHLWFREGIIVDARVGLEIDEKAARMILGFRTGDYAFFDGPAGDAKGPLELKPSTFVMNLMRIQDEALSETHVLNEGFVDELPGL